MKCSVARSKIESFKSAVSSVGCDVEKFHFFFSNSPLSRSVWTLHIDIDSKRSQFPRRTTLSAFSGFSHVERDFRMIHRVWCVFVVRPSFSFHWNAESMRSASREMNKIIVLLCVLLLIRCFDMQTPKGNVLLINWLNSLIVCRISRVFSFFSSHLRHHHRAVQWVDSLGGRIRLPLKIDQIAMKGKFYSFLAHTIHLFWVIKNSILVVIISLARTQILFPIAASRTKKIRELNFFALGTHRAHAMMIGKNVVTIE